jgi:hypothetical protein
LIPHCGRSAYIGVVSHLYGQVPDSKHYPERLPLTELEFRRLAVKK